MTTPTPHACLSAMHGMCDPRRGHDFDDTVYCVRRHSAVSAYTRARVAARATRDAGGGHAHPAGLLHESGLSSTPLDSCDSVPMRLFTRQAR